jgi:hypothetical protein
MKTMEDAQLRVRLWAVVGPANSGKSSTIGALAGFSGKGAGGQRDVLLRGGGFLQIHAYRQSVQEAGTTPEESASKALANARRKSNQAAIQQYNLLLALRSDSIKGLPTAREYLSYYLSCGWEIVSLALLDMAAEYDRYADIGAPTCEVLKSIEYSTEERSRIWVFGQVRNHFGWA